MKIKLLKETSKRVKNITFSNLTAVTFCIATLTYHHVI